MGSQQVQDQGPGEVPPLQTLRELRGLLGLREAVGFSPALPCEVRATRSSLTPGLTAGQQLLPFSYQPQEPVGTLCPPADEQQEPRASLRHGVNSAQQLGPRPCIWTRAH